MADRSGFPASRVLSSLGFALLSLVLLGEFGALGWISHNLKTRGRQAAVSVAAPSATTTSTPPVSQVPVNTTAAPTTSAPAQVTGPSVSGSGTVTYTLAAGTHVQISVTDKCWVEARRGGESGPILLATDLVAGQTETLEAPLWLRFGNASVATVTVGATKLQLPSAISAALQLQVG